MPLYQPACSMYVYVYDMSIDVYHMHHTCTFICVHPCTGIYIYRVKAGGSPERNYILLKWIFKMFILHWFLQCFMASNQFAGSLKLSDVARTNSEFVRAEKLTFNHFLEWIKMLVPFFPQELWYHVFFVVLWFRQKCHNSLENHGRNDIRTFFIFTSTSINFILTSSTSINFINVSIIILNVS